MGRQKTGTYWSDSRNTKNEKRDSALKIITINLPERHLQALDKLDYMGAIVSRSAGVRSAVAFWLRDIFQYEEKIDDFLEDDDPAIIRVPGVEQPFTIILNKNHANKGLE